MDSYSTRYKTSNEEKRNKEKKEKKRNRIVESKRVQTEVTKIGTHRLKRIIMVFVWPFATRARERARARSLLISLTND